MALTEGRKEAEKEELRDRTDGIDKEKERSKERIKRENKEQ